jgi:hypothetical protein
MNAQLTYMIAQQRSAELQRAAERRRLDADATRLRPIGGDDRDRLAALFARLGFESRCKRFLSPKRELTPGELSYYCDIDHVLHEAIVAVDQRDGSIVGVGRYAHDADRAGVR